MSAPGPLRKFLPAAKIPIMKFSIRTAAEQDISALHRLRCSVQENALTDPSRVTESSYLPYVDAGDVLLAERGKRLLGFAALDHPSSNLWALFVAPEAEGMGVGRALHLQIVQRARELGAGALWLSTSGGTRAERFYIAAGWQKTGLTPDGELRLRLSVPI